MFAALALAGALGVVLMRNPVHAALMLVVTLVCVAVFFLQNDAELLAAVQIIVYAGAIVVLFLFVIMLLGVDRAETLHDPVRFQRPTALALGAILLAEVLFLGGHTWATGADADRLDADPAAAATSATTSSGSRASCSPTSSGRSSSPRRCWCSRSSARSCSPPQR